MYMGPPDRSPLEIVRNYEGELKENGFETLYSCAAAECGERDDWLSQYYLYPTDKSLKNTPPPGSGAVPGAVSEYALSEPIDQRYLAARRARPEGESVSPSRSPPTGGRPTK